MRVLFGVWQCGCSDLQPEMERMEFGSRIPTRCPEHDEPLIKAPEYAGPWHPIVMGHRCPEPQEVDHE